MSAWARWKFNLVRFIVFVTLLARPGIASAHAFGQRYDLPIPLWLYLWGAGAAIVFSFVVIGFFLGTPPDKTSSRDLSTTSLMRWLIRQHWLGFLIRLLPILLFGLSIATALFGSHDPNNNFAPTFFWINFWVGLPLLSVLLGNFWEYINPWLTSFRWVAGSNFRPPWTYPSGWGVWPALFFFLLFTWMELVPGNAYFPNILAMLLVGYSIVLFAGAVLFGEQWIRNTEFFSVLSRLVGAISPIGWKDGKMILRPPGTGLMDVDTATPGLIPFTLFFLAGVTYDGFKESLVWSRMIETVTSFLPLSPLAIGTLGLLLSFAFFNLLYFIFTVVAKALTKTNQSLADLARHFIISHLPIGLAYTIAHYYTLLLITGQGILPLLSDPFGTGADWLGTAAYKIDITVVGPKFIWYSQVALVVLGHILAVYIAHLVALKIFPSPKVAMLSQYPMLVLMVGLTMLSLWILSAQLVG